MRDLATSPSYSINQLIVNQVIDEPLWDSAENRISRELRLVVSKWWERWEPAQ
jgi:hypothetical protein